MCRFHVVADTGCAPCQRQWHQPSEDSLPPTGPIKPWFLTEGKLAAVLIIPSSWGLPTRLPSGHISPTLGRAWWASGRPGHRLSSPLRLFNPLNPNFIGDGVIFHENHKEAQSPRKSNLGLLQACSGTLPEGEIIAGGLFITIIASVTMCE